MSSSRSALFPILLLLFRRFRGNEANNIACYVSHANPTFRFGFDLEVPTLESCDGQRGVLKGNKVNRLAGLEHTDADPVIFVKANTGRDFLLKKDYPNGLQLQGPLLFVHWFSSVDDLKCFKMTWTCTKGDFKGNVSKYGVMLKDGGDLCLMKDGKTKLNNCKVDPCEESYCNGGWRASAVFALTLLVLLRALLS